MTRPDSSHPSIVAFDQPVDPDEVPSVDREPAVDLRAHIRRVGAGITVISLVGAVDLATTGVFATALTDMADAARDGEWIVLDLDRVTFLSAHGLAVLAHAHDHARRNEATVLLLAGRSGAAASSLRFLPSGQVPYLSLNATTLDGAAAVPVAGPKTRSEPRDLARRRDEVIAALGRVFDGTFARCDVCAARIPDRLLRVNPAANRCIAHARQPDRHPNTDQRPGTDHHRDRDGGRHHGPDSPPAPEGNDDDHTRT